MAAYLARALGDADLATLRSDVERLRARSRFRVERASFAVGRVAAALEPASASARTLGSARVLETLRRVAGDDSLALLGDFPIEVRVCGVGAAMDWHSDVVLYEPAQWEVVWTLWNTSDAATEWEEVDRGEGDVAMDEIVTRRVRTEPGSALVFRAGSELRHRVLPSTRGERVIIKALYTTAGRVKTENFAEALDSAPWRR